MFGLSLILILAGLLGRGPWVGDDLEGTALARGVQLALAAGEPLGVLLPSTVIPSAESIGLLGPLLSGLFLGLISALLQAFGAPDPGPAYWDDLLRLFQGGLFGLGLWSLWQATRRLTLRREARPADPLRIGPDAVSLGRTLGDCAVLLALGCVGTVIPLHSAGSFGLAIALQGLLLWMVSRAPEEPQRSGLMTGLLMGLLLLTVGLGPFLGWCLGLAFALARLEAWRLVWRDWLPRALLACGLIVALWISALVVSTGSAGIEALHRWLAVGLQWSAVSEWTSAPKTFVWSWWPLWPLSLAAIVFCWRSGYWPDHLRLLMACSAGLVVGGLFPGDDAVRDLLPLIPLAALSAFGLMALGRSLSSLIDWISVLLFSSLGILVWLYWTAYQSGTPAVLAKRLQFFAPSLPPSQIEPIALVLGIAVSLAWIALVLWRVGRGAGPRLWRPVVLSLGGLSVGWILLTTLWAPALKDLRGYDTMSSQLQRVLATRASDCIQTLETDIPARRVALALTRQAATSNSQDGCGLLLSSKALPRSFRDATGAQLIWSGRRSRDRSLEDRYRLYSLVSPIKAER